MANALSDYLREIERQRELLNDANERDDRAEQLACQNVVCPAGRRKVWTRQDRNRVEYGIEIEDFHQSRLQGGAPMDRISKECIFPIPKRRMSTRIGRILSRLKSPDKRIDGWHQRAMAESQANGTFNTIAPMIVAATDAHKRLLEAYHEVDRGGCDDWEEVILGHDEAICDVSKYVVSAELPNTVTITVPTERDTKPQTQGQRKQSENRPADLKLPSDPDELALWRELQSENGTVSDRKIAKKWHEKKGATVLNRLITKRSRKKISDWRK